MKHIQKTAALLCAAMILCSCGGESSMETTEPIGTTTTAATTTPATTITSTTTAAATTTSAESAPSAEELNANLPRMDGSTSATPLEIGLKSGFLGISYTQAKTLVSHTTTHDSFKRLIGGEVDLIFSVPISEEQQKAADEAGVTLFMEPVAKEGFVFVVNAENPVDSLTSEQLRGIYSGEITNWSQVGGNNEPILPYQRNSDSGSQNYMTVFMGDTPLLPPKTELIEGFMGSLMDAIATYDNSAGAIGYSVYSYAAQMYANANQVKFIAVDGVAPSKATMADESYPLLSCTYAIYTDKSPESAREFVEKAISDEGQGYVLDSGYLPVNGMEVPERYLPYEAVGTGAPKPADFTPSRQYSWGGVHWIETEDGYFELRCLKDEEFQARINADLREAVDELNQYADPNDPEWKIEPSFRMMNGYLSILLGVRDDPLSKSDLNTIYAYDPAITLNYDLFAQKKIERFSDLFYEGEDFMTDVNRAIEHDLEVEVYPYIKDMQKLDFSGILGEPRLFTTGWIVLEPNNPYLTCTPILSYWDSDLNRVICLRSLVGQYRDNREVIDESSRSYQCVEEYEYAEWETEHIVENGVIFKTVVGSSFHTDEEVAETNALWRDLQERTRTLFASIGYDWQTWKAESGYFMPIWLRIENHCYNIGTYSSVAGEEPRANYDIDTLELITMEMLLGEDWRQYLPDGEDGLFYIPSEWWHWDGEILIIAITKREEGDRYRWVHFKVPMEEVNPRYLSEE